MTQERKEELGLVLEMVSPFLGHLLVMLAQHEHYEMRGMQWPKCVKHVHKVTIKPI